MGCSRSTSRKPVTLPMLHLGCCGLNLRHCVSWWTVDGVNPLDAEHALVLMREDLDELRLRVGPVLEDPRSARASGVIAMALKQGAHFSDIFVGFERLKIHAGLVTATCGEVTLIVEYEGTATAHTGGEVAARCAEHNDSAIGHVFAAVIAYAFYNRNCAGVADGEALASNAVEEDFAAGGAIENHVTDENALFRKEEGCLRRGGNDAAAGEALAEVVVAVAFEFEGHTGGDECAEALASGAFEFEVDGVVGQSNRPIATGD